MIIDAGMHGANEANVVGDFSQGGDEFAQFHSGLSVSGEFPGRAEEFRAGLGGIVVLDVSSEGLHVSFCEFGLGIEEVDLAGAPLHEHGDHGLCLRFARRGLGFEIECGAFEFGFCGSSGAAIAVQQPCEREA